MSTTGYVPSKKRASDASGGRAFCKHCDNMNLPSGHWLRDKDGRTTCPVLLATECRYCHEKGHTLSNCEKRNLRNQKLASSASAGGRGSERGLPPPSTTTFPTISKKKIATDDVVSNASKGSFSMFISSSDSEEDAMDIEMPPPVAPTILSLIHPEDCYSDDDRMPPYYTPIHFSCLDKYTPGSRWTEIEYAYEEDVFADYDDHLVSPNPNDWFEPIMHA